MEAHPRRWHTYYLIILACLVPFFVAALIAGPVSGIPEGLWRIFTHRSTVGTDYITTGGLAAALVNAGLVGIACTLLMVGVGAKPNGAILMAIWMVTGFGFFGVNPFNMLPVTLGVWLYSRFQREPFLNFSLTALLACTLCPVVSDIAFMGRFTHYTSNLLAGVVAGLAVGFLLPILAAATTRVHSGYNLYNIGFAGGILAVFLSALRQSTAEYPPYVSNPSEGNNLFFAILLCVVMVGWMLPVLLKRKRAPLWQDYKKISAHSGRLVSDYVLLYGDAAIINMGTLGLLGTLAVIAYGGQVNGATLAGIFSVMGFGAFGKHARNCIPVMAGAMLMAAVNLTPHNETANMCAILFSTGLAPIAGQYGIVWGIVAGMLHMGIVAFTGTITGGLNLFNNGFAAGFVALLLVPVILAFKRGKKHHEA